MIDVKIKGELHELTGKLDHCTGLVYVEYTNSVQVETVQNLISKSYVLIINNVPEDPKLFEGWK